MEWAFRKKSSFPQMHSKLAAAIVLIFASEPAFAESVAQATNNCLHVEACMDHCGVPEANVEDLEARCSVKNILAMKRSGFNANSFQGSDTLTPAAREQVPAVNTLCRAARKIGDSECDNLYNETHRAGDACIGALYLTKNHFSLDNIPSNTNQSSAQVANKQIGDDTATKAVASQKICSNFHAVVGQHQWYKNIPDKLVRAPSLMTQTTAKGSTDEGGVLLADNQLRHVCGGSGSGFLGNFFGKGGLAGDPAKFRQRSDDARRRMINQLGIQNADVQNYIMRARVEELYCLNNEYIAELQLQKERVEASEESLNAINTNLVNQYNIGNLVSNTSGGTFRDLKALVTGDSGSASNVTSSQNNGGAPVLNNTTNSSSGVTNPLGSLANTAGGAVSAVGSAAVNNAPLLIGGAAIAGGVVLATSGGGGSSSSGQATTSGTSANTGVSAYSINAMSAGSSSSSSSSTNSNNGASSVAQGTTAIPGTSTNPNTSTLAANNMSEASGVSSTKNLSGASAASSSLKDAVRDRLNNAGGASPGAGIANSSGAFGQLSGSGDGKDNKALAKINGFSSVGVMNESGAEGKAPVAVSGSDTDASIKDIMQNMQSMMGGAVEPMENLSNSVGGGESRSPASTQGKSGYAFDREVAAADTAPLFERVHESINRCLNKGCIINGLRNKL